jgi:succinoglycan biosynthesis transport protein ExoP
MPQPKSSSASAAVSSPDLRARLYRYRLALRRYWWLALLIVSAALAVQGWLVANAPASYASLGRMWVSGKVNIPEGGLYREEYANFFGTQMEVMRGALLQKRTYDRLRLLKPKLEQSPVELSVAVAPRTSVFILRASGGDPVFVKEFLQAHMDEFLLYKKELRIASADTANSSLIEQLLKSEKDLKTAQEQLLMFQQTNNVNFLQEQGSSAAGYLAKLNIRLADLRTEYQLLDLMLSETNQANAPKLPSSGGDALQFAGYIKAREQHLLLKAEREDLGRYLKPKHPKIIKMDEEIARQERTLEIFKQQTAEQLGGTRNSLRLQIASMDESIKEWETKAAEANRKMAQFDQLKANVTRAQGLHERLLGTTQNVGVSRNLDQENIAIMENATLAAQVKSSALKRMILAALAGLLGAALLLYLIERNDDRINSVSELASLFTIPAVGQVPEIKAGKGRLDLVHPQDLRHNFVESFRDIRSSLLFASTGAGRPHTVIVTSAIPSEGKSAVSSNLAVTLALSGARVLLVDADLRCGVMHEVFGGQAEPGLHEILLGETSWQEVLRSTATPNLNLISRGNSTQVGGELFLSQNLPNFLQQVRDEFDFVIIDSAPVLAVADTPTLAPKADGVIFVIRSRYTSSRLCRTALDALGQRNVPVIGLVLNRAEEASPTYYNYKYSKYYHAGSKPERKTAQPAPARA